jgi:Fe-S cluster assembly protein SufD
VRQTLRHEEWKYLNLMPLLKLGLESATASAEPELGSSIKVVNGAVVQITEGATLVANEEIDVVPGTAAASPFVAFNREVAAQTIEVRVPKGVQSQSVMIDVIGDGTRTAVLHATRIRIVAEEGSQVVVHERHHAAGTNDVLGVVVTELEAFANSRLEYVKTTQLPANARHIGSTIARVFGGAQLHTHALCLGGPLVRNDLYVRLEQSGAEAYVNGLSVLHGSDVADNHTAVDHIAPHCHSEELYKGIYHDASTGIFNGKILVRPHAQKTTAYQSSRSLLLGARAQVNAKPQLEIWADDVKCSHGATTGQLDPEAIFYLRSRSLSPEQARELLVDAFAKEMYDRLPENGERRTETSED